MNNDLDQVLGQLQEASLSFASGKFEQACACLSAASALLDTCLSESAQEQVSTLDITPADLDFPDAVDQPAKPRAFAMAS